VFQKNFTLFVFAITYSNVNRHLTIYFRQGSVETHIRCGGQYTLLIFAVALMDCPVSRLQLKLKQPLMLTLTVALI